jgi:hypothetical protein
MGDRLSSSREQFITIYVKFFRHYRTKKIIYPKPPNRFIKLSIPLSKWKAYQQRKQTKKTAA